MIRTGILGGSFNPIHKGHEYIAQQVCHSQWVDELWLMVSPQNPLKVNQHLLDDQLRLKLAQIAVEEQEKIQVSDFEFHLSRPSYMYNTLQELKKTYPERQFVLVIGADNWNCFDKWYKADKIIEEFEMVIYPREGFIIDHSTLPPTVHFLEMPLYTLSSTQIREALKEGKDVSAYLNKGVWAEIKKQTIDWE